MSEPVLTCGDIFDRAILLMAENDDTSGSTVTSDTTEYKVRTLGILNVLVGECYPYSDTFVSAEDGKRPVLPKIVRTVADEPDSWMSAKTGLDDYLNGTVLPYGLAAKLYIGEDTTQASFFHERYQELLQQAKNIPAVAEDIVDVYGYDSEYNEYSRWY